LDVTDNQIAKPKVTAKVTPKPEPIKEPKPVTIKKVEAKAIPAPKPV